MQHPVSLCYVDKPGQVAKRTLTQTCPRVRVKCKSGANSLLGMLSAQVLCLPAQLHVSGALSVRERDGFSDNNADPQNMQLPKEGEAGLHWVFSGVERQNLGVNSS